MKRKETLAAAESCTGGLFSASITRIPGSSDYFKGAFITYQLAAKERFLKIPRSLLKKENGVSAEIAGRMAEQVRKVFKSDWGIGITGIAGPSGGTVRHPVGTVYIGIAGKKSKQTVRFKFSGTRTMIQSKACHETIRFLTKVLVCVPGDSHPLSL